MFSKSLFPQSKTGLFMTTNQHLFSDLGAIFHKWQSLIRAVERILRSRDALQSRYPYSNFACSGDKSWNTYWFSDCCIRLRFLYVRQ